MDLVRQRVADSKVLALVSAFLNQKILEELREWTPTEGTPQGAVISPLLADLYLHPLDVRMREAGYEMTRYADDCAPRRRGKETVWLPVRSLAAQGMRGGPSEPVDRDRLQTTVGCSGQEPG